jgi:hypothetical protein
MLCETCGAGVGTLRQRMGANGYRTAGRWLRGDLNHRPLGYEPIDGCNAIQKQATTAYKALHLGSEFLAGLGWFCTLFPHISRTSPPRRVPISDARS